MAMFCDRDFYLNYTGVSTVLARHTCLQSPVFHIDTSNQLILWRTTPRADCLPYTTVSTLNNWTACTPQSASLSLSRPRPLKIGQLNTDSAGHIHCIAKDDCKLYWFVSTAINHNRT